MAQALGQAHRNSSRRLCLNRRCIRRLLLSFACAFAAWAQTAPNDVQALVEKLYPKNTRLKEIRMPDIVRQLGIAGGSRVADVGCGSGRLSVILARVVGGAGAVYCEDISNEKEWGLPAAKAEFKKQKVRNVRLIRGLPDDPRLPAASLDAVMIVNSYHEMPKHQDMLRHIRDALKPGARLVIMDNRPNRTATRPREKQTNNHVLSPELAAAELEAAGFRIVHRDDTFIDNPDSESAHWLIAAERPAP